MEDKEKARRFKWQARMIARSLASRFTLEESIAAERYSGGAVCPDCGLEYHDHPWIEDGLAKGLTITCRGTLVKL